MLWARDTFLQEGCQLIINDGDFLDSETIRPETNYLISHIYKNNKQKEYILLGNHEKKDAEGKYNALNILDNYPNISIINELKVIPLKDEDTVLIFQPYMKSDWKDLCATLDKYKDKKRILFSHLGYDNVPNVNSMLKGEIDYNLLKDRVDKIFNGHIHIGLESDKYIQVGILTGLNFSDAYPFHKPGIIIYNTETDEVKRIENPNAILYQKCKYTDINSIKDIERTHLRVECPSDKIEKVTEQCEKLNCLSYKIKVILEEKQKEVDREKVDFNLYTNPSQALYDFFKTDKSVFTEEQINTFLDEYIKEK